MERERFHSEPADGSSVVPDTIPDELIAAYRAEAREVVAASVTPQRRARLWADSSDGARSAGDVGSIAVGAAARAACPRSGGQRLQAVLAVLVGYLGLAALTAWWWSLAQADGTSTWWPITVVGAAGLAVATLALLGWAVAGLVRRRRRRVTEGNAR